MVVVVVDVVTCCCRSVFPSLASSSSFFFGTGLFLLLLRLLLLSISCILFDVLLFSNGLLGTHDRNIAPCGIICRGAMGATVFWVCRKWNNKEWWGWFVLLVYLIVEDIEEPAHDLELLL